MKREALLALAAGFRESEACRAWIRDDLQRDGDRVETDAESPRDGGSGSLRSGSGREHFPRLRWG